MSEQPRVTAIWLGPKNSTMPTMVDGEAYSLEPEGITKWVKIEFSNDD